MLLSKLMDLIKELIDRKFYGTIEIVIQAGKFVHIKKTESIKLDD